jgi:hypothetical protein
MNRSEARGDGCGRRGGSVRHAAASRHFGRCGNQVLPEGEDVGDDAADLAAASAAACLHSSCWGPAA